MIPMTVSGQMEIRLPSCFFLLCFSFEFSTNRDHVCNAYTCDDLLRQYHLFTVLHFCWESERLCGGNVCSASSRLSLSPTLSPNYFTITSILTHQLTLGPAKATSRKYNSSFYVYQYSGVLYSMEILPIYQEIDLFFLQCYTIICIKNSQSPKSAMPHQDHPPS